MSNDIDLYTMKINYLKDGINDVAGNIKFIDTKIALMMTVEALIINALISTREGVCYFIKETDGIEFVSVAVIMFIFLYTLAMFLYKSICCVFTRIKLSKKVSSVWYNDLYDSNYLMNKVVEQSYITICDAYTEELNILNHIFTDKAEHSRIAIKFFSINLVVTIIFTCMLSIYYLSL